MTDVLTFAEVEEVLGDGGLGTNLVKYGGLAPEAVEWTVYRYVTLPREAIGLHTRPNHHEFLPRIDTMRRALRDGKRLPPVVVAVLDDRPYAFECYDGYHRLHSYKAEGISMVPAYEWLKEGAR